jgi:two-component system chemotaxis response regulator CheY
MRVAAFMLPDNLKILIVEDNLITQVFLKKIFKNLGYEKVSVAVDGEAALMEVKKNRFNLILSDWNMPHMSGLEFLRAVRKVKNYKTVPFVMLTMEMQREKIMEALEAGVDHYLIKPLSPPALLKKLEEIFKD